MYRLFIITYSYFIFFKGDIDDSGQYLIDNYIFISFVGLNKTKNSKDKTNLENLLGMPNFC
jgi:hypothetical protein